MQRMELLNRSLSGKTDDFMTKPDMLVYDHKGRVSTEPIFTEERESRGNEDFQ
jgi:hypothetical protein